MKDASLYGPEPSDWLLSHSVASCPCASSASVPPFGHHDLRVGRRRSGTAASAAQERGVGAASAILTVRSSHDLECPSIGSVKNGRVVLQVLEPPEREADVVRGQRVAGGELHARAQLERVDRAVRRTPSTDVASRGWIFVRVRRVDRDRACRTPRCPGSATCTRTVRWTSLVT